MLNLTNSLNFDDNNKSSSRRTLTDVLQAFKKPPIVPAVKV